MLDYLITAHLQSTPLLAQRTHRDEAVECAGVNVGGRGVALQHRLVHHMTLGVRSKSKLVLTDRPPQEVTECSEYLDNIQGKLFPIFLQENWPTCECIVCVVCVFVHVYMGREKSAMQVACYHNVTRIAI